MKIVFLDFDFVLNDRAYLEATEGAFRGPGKWNPARELDPEKLRLVNQLLDRGGPMTRIVVTSAWRLGRHTGELREILESRGLRRRRVVGKTPSLPGCRGEEIAWFLENALLGVPLESYVILDDDSDMNPVSLRLVKTTAAEGLTQADVEIALRHLQSPLPDDLVDARAARRSSLRSRPGEAGTALPPDACAAKRRTPAPALAPALPRDLR